MSKDYLHSYFEEITNNVIKPFEKEQKTKNLNDKEQEQRVKELIVWLIAFARTRGEKNGNR